MHALRSVVSVAACGTLRRRNQPMVGPQATLPAAAMTIGQENSRRRLERRFRLTADSLT